MSKPTLYTLSEAAQLLGVDRHTVSDLARVLGIVTKPMINGKAKGLDEADMKRLRKSLSIKADQLQPVA